MLLRFDTDPTSSSVEIKQFIMAESEFTCHGCGASGRDYEKVFSKDLCRQCGKMGKEFYPDVKLDEAELKSTVIVICESEGQQYAESVCSQLAKQGINAKIWTEYIKNGMSNDQVAQTAQSIGETAGSTFIILTKKLFPNSKIARLTLATNENLPDDTPRKVLFCPAPGFDVTQLSEKILKENTIVMADESEVARVHALGKRGNVVSMESVGRTKTESAAEQSDPQPSADTESPAEAAAQDYTIQSSESITRPAAQDTLPHLNPRQSKHQIEVVALACPKCGGTIDGPGKCGFCGHFLLVLENGSYLYIDKEDIKDVIIKPPKVSSDTATWMFELKGQGKDIRFIQEDLWIIGSGNVEYGAAIAALYFRDNSDKHGLGGQLVPTFEQVKAYALKAAMKQAILRQGK